jgi:hypothetical protein
MIRGALRRALSRRPRSLCGMRTDTVLVIIAQWRRPQRFAATLEALAAQDVGRPISVVVWNNHRLTGRWLRRQIEDVGLRGALAEVRLVQSRANLGGIARFVALRHLRDAGRRGPVLTIDDDMDFGPAFVRSLLEAWTPRSIVGAWAWQVHGGYFDRTPSAPGGPADFVGTGGAALDIDIVEDDAFFDRLPDRYLSVEDLWASRWASTLGWRLGHASTDVKFSDDEHGQHLRLGDRKHELWPIAGALARGERVAVEPDPTGGLGIVGPRERLRAALGSIDRAVHRVARR